MIIKQNTADHDDNPVDHHLVCRHLFFKTGKPELRTNPLAGESEKGESGVVVEYFSQEMGFVKLDSEDGLVVLFHLNQVIIKRSLC